MGFHGYGGHTSCIIGDSPIADYPEGPEIHYHSLDSSPHSHGRNLLHPDRTIVPRHRNEGPVDLSQYCTPTGRGTWSIGGQHAHRQTASHIQIQYISNHYATRGQQHVASTLCPRKQIIPADDTTPFKDSRPRHPTPNVDTPKLTAESKDAKKDRSISDTERVELEKKAAPLLDLVRAMAFPIPVWHTNSYIFVNSASFLGTGKAPAFSPPIMASHRVNANDDIKGWYGIFLLGDTLQPIGGQRSGISKNPGSRSGSDWFSREANSELSFEGLPEFLSSCGEIDNETHEAGKRTV